MLSSVSIPKTDNIFGEFVLHVGIYLFMYDSFKKPLTHVAIDWLVVSFTSLTDPPFYMEE